MRVRREDASELFDGRSAGQLRQASLASGPGIILRAENTRRRCGERSGVRRSLVPAHLATAASARAVSAPSRDVVAEAGLGRQGNHESTTLTCCRALASFQSTLLGGYSAHNLCGVLAKVAFLIHHASLAVADPPIPFLAVWLIRYSVIWT